MDEQKFVRANDLAGLVASKILKEKTTKNLWEEISEEASSRSVVLRLLCLLPLVFSDEHLDRLIGVRGTIQGAIRIGVSIQCVY